MSSYGGATPAGAPLTESQIATAGDSRYAQIYTPNPGALWGLTMSTAGSSATLSVAAGFAADSTNVRLMRLASSLAKTTSAWTAGAGGALDTGTIVINTWYHWFVIMNVTSGAVDVLCSTSPTTPTLPSGYTLSRRIGSACTNGSSQWFKFFQSGDDFVWDVPASIYSNGSNPSTTVTLNTGTPLGVSVLANLLGYLSGSAAGNGIKLYETRQTNSGVSPSGNITSLIPTASGYANITALVRTDVTSQITMVATTTGMNIQLVALGWTDTRGRVA